MSGMEVPADIVGQSSYCATLLVCIFLMWTLQQFCLGFCRRCLSSAQAGSKFYTSIFVFMKGRSCLEHYRNFYFTHILLHFANSLRIILTFLGHHCGVGLQLIEETRWQFIWKDPSFSCEYSQLSIHKLCAFLGCSNHKQFFLFKAFCFHNFIPSLRKILAAPLELCIEKLDIAFIHASTYQIGPTKWRWHIQHASR